MATKLIDYSTWRADVDELKRLGAAGVVRYLSVVNDKTRPKLLTRDGAQRLLAGGLSISLVWEWYVGRPLEGAPAGVDDVRVAEAQADEIGAPLEVPIFYAVDTDTTLEKVRAYFQAVNATNRRPVGVYGSYQIVHGLMAEGLAAYGWQTTAWSRGRVCSHAHLLQNVFRPNYDLNDVRKPFPTWTTTPVDKPDVEEPKVEEPAPDAVAFVKPDRGSRTAWLRVNARGAKVAAGGYWVTTRTLAMYLEACRLFRHFGGGTPPGITQGGRNAGGVAQSAGTHDREALDWSTKDLDARLEDLWELCCWVVGFASWQREFIAGRNGWPRHDHGVPKGGDLSRGAADQVRDFARGRDGLVSDRVYSRIGRMGVGAWTWENYLDAFTVSLPGLLKAIADRVEGVDVKRLQWSLSCLLRRDIVADGDPGPVTKAAIAEVVGGRQLGVDVLAELGLPTSTNVIDTRPPPPAPKWPQVTGDKPAPDYWVTASELNGRDVAGTVKKVRPAGFHIGTPDAIVVGGDLVPSEAGTRRWLRTRAGYFYALEFLTTEKPVTPPKTITVATWNPYAGNSLANMKAGLAEIAAAGADALGVQELSDDAKQKGLAAYAKSIGWAATRRNSAVTCLYNTRTQELVAESFTLVDKGGWTWEDGAGGPKAKYKGVMELTLRDRATGEVWTLLNHHPVATVESGGVFRDDKPKRVGVYRKMIGAICRLVLEHGKGGRFVAVTADQNVAWGAGSASSWVEAQYDRVGLTVNWDEATDVDTHTGAGSRSIDWVAGTGYPESTRVLDRHDSDHFPVVVRFNLKGKAA